MSKAPDRMQFRMLGGSRQLVVRTGDDLRHAAALDTTHWALTGTQTDSLVCERDFLKEMDSDGNGRIRCDEVKSALNWMLGLLVDLTGVEQGSDELKIDAVTDATPAGRDIRETIRLALINLDLPDADGITFAQICDHGKLVSDALLNGDGIIPPDPVKDPLTADCIRAVMKLIGTHKDVSGLDGIDGDALTAFEKLASGYLAWRTAGDAEAEKIRPYGEKTAVLFDAMSAIEAKTDDFFRSVETLRFGAGDAKRNAASNTFDAMDIASVNAFLEKSPVANPDSGTLCDSEEVNPLWREKVRVFFSALADAKGKSEAGGLDGAAWNTLKAELAPFGAWLKAKNTPVFDGFDGEKLKRFSAENTYTAIRAMIADDLAVSKNLVNCKEIRRLILYQKHMLSFLNNFVCLSDLFSNQKDSMIQAGKLVLDGRVFTLCTLLPNPAEHKKIVMESDICVMYLDISRGTGADLKTMKVAVAVTSGDVRNIFIGKSGVFVTPDNLTWDAKIFDFVKQPVSISEALKEPFYKFSEFLQKQADKFFSARSKAYEDGVSKNIQSKALPVTSAAPPAAQTPAVSGSMMLMGGGIGIAAIGSAFAFMAKSLQGISAGTVLAVLLGILLIFGGPVILISMIKLFSRNLSLFFEANGNAINMRMRLSLKMGRLFTYTPKLPARSLILAEHFDFFPTSEEGSKSLKGKIIWLVTLLIFTAGCVWLAYSYFKPAADAVMNFFNSLAMKI